MEDKYRPISMALNCPAIKFNSSPLAQRRSCVCVMAKTIPSFWVDSMPSLATAKLSNSQGELEEEHTRLIKELGAFPVKDYALGLQAVSATEKRNYLAGTSKGKERIEGEREDDVTVQHEGEHEDMLTRLKKVLQLAMPATEKDMFEEEKRSLLEPAGALALAGAEAYCKYYGLKGENVVATRSGANMNFDRLRLVTELADVGRKREAVFATYMPEERKGAGTSKGERPKGEGEDDVTVQHERKYEAGTSNGRELIEGEGEDDVTAQYIADTIGSVFKERLKDDDLLFSLSLPPPDFVLFQRAEEREHNFALPQMTEEREHNFALSQRAEGKENKNWFGGLGSVVPLVINVGICAATYIGVCLLYKDAGKKVDVLALRLKAVNEAWDAAGCPPPTVCVLNPSVTISSLFALFNFGNPSTTVSTPVGLFNRGNPSTTVSPLLGLININIGK